MRRSRLLLVFVVASTLLLLASQVHADTDEDKSDESGPSDIFTRLSNKVKESGRRIAKFFKRQGRKIKYRDMGYWKGGIKVMFGGYQKFFEKYYEPQQDKAQRFYQFGGAEIWVTYDTVTKLLQEVPNKQMSGDIVKKDELGILKFNKKGWEGFTDYGLGLGAPLGIHRRVRPVMDMLYGNGGRWESMDLEEYANSFFEASPEVINTDVITSWAMAFIYHVVTGQEPSDEITKMMPKLQRLALLKGILPSWAAGLIKNVKQMRRKLTNAMIAHSKLSAKEGKMSKIFARVEGLNSAPESAQLKKQLSDTSSLVNTILQGAFVEESQSLKNAAKSDRAPLNDHIQANIDAILFAGGASVSQIITSVLSITFSAPKGSSKVALTKNNLDIAVNETIRLFPAVMGAPFYYKQSEDGNKLGHRILPIVGATGRDKYVWDDVTKFRMDRPLVKYEKQMGVFWANQANVGTAYSRGCPAMRMSLAMIRAFVKKFIKNRHRYDLSKAAKIKWTDAVPFSKGLNIPLKEAEKKKGKTMPVYSVQLSQEEQKVQQKVTQLTGVQDFSG